VGIAIGSIAPKPPGAAAAAGGATGGCGSGGATGGGGSGAAGGGGSGWATDAGSGAGVDRWGRCGGVCAVWLRGCGAGVTWGCGAGVTWGCGAGVAWAGCHEAGLGVLRGVRPGGVARLAGSVTTRGAPERRLWLRIDRLADTML
jgi:hypothetical protein